MFSHNDDDSDGDNVYDDDNDGNDNDSDDDGYDGKNLLQRWETDRPFCVLPSSQFSSQLKSCPIGNDDNGSDDDDNGDDDFF